MTRPRSEPAVAKRHCAGIEVTDKTTLLWPYTVAWTLADSESEIKKLLSLEPDMIQRPFSAQQTDRASSYERN